MCRVLRRVASLSIIISAWLILSTDNIKLLRTGGRNPCTIIHYIPLPKIKL